CCRRAGAPPAPRKPVRPESEPAAAAPAGGPYRLPRLELPALRAALALAAGTALTASFAPFNLWPLALVSPAALMWLWQDAGPREAARLGFLFSAATFAAGTYWLYVSIHVNGGAPVWLAVVLMVGLVASWASIRRRSGTRWRA